MQLCKLPPILGHRINNIISVGITIPIVEHLAMFQWSYYATKFPDYEGYSARQNESKKGLSAECHWRYYNYKMDAKRIIDQINVLLAEFERARRVSSYDDLFGGLPDWPGFH